MPRSFELPKHREQLMKIIKRGKSSDLWIAKPSYGSTARGIYVFNKDSKVGIPDENLKGQDAAWIIQQYLNPLLFITSFCFEELDLYSKDLFLFIGLDLILLFTWDGFLFLLKQEILSLLISTLLRIVSSV